MMMSDDAKKKAAMVIIGVGGDSLSMEKDEYEEAEEGKEYAVKELIEAIEDKDVEGVKEALTYFVKLCSYGSE